MTPRQANIAAAAARLYARVVEDPTTGCLLWTGGCIKSGYSQIRVRGVKSPMRGHRVTAEHAFGPLPDGMVVDHTCHNGTGCEGGFTCVHRRCLNPAHLEVVESKVNILRGWRPSKPTCGQGHPRTEENMWVSPTSGERECRICRRAWNKSRRLRQAPERAA